MDYYNIDFVTYCTGNLSRRLGLIAGEAYRRLKLSGIHITKDGTINDTNNAQTLSDVLGERVVTIKRDLYVIFAI